MSSEVNRRERFLTVDEVADRLRCRRETIRRYIVEGRLPALQIPGGFYRVRESDLEGFLRPVVPKRAKVK